MEVKQLSLLEHVVAREEAIAPPSEFSTGGGAAPPEGCGSFPQSYVTPSPPHPPRLHKTSGVVQIRRRGGVTYRQEKVRCGKVSCRSCPHGPYWYAYWRQGDKTKSKYVGKQLPAEVLEREFEENAEELPDGAPIPTACPPMAHIY